MKKTLIAMIAAAFCVSSAMAQVLVYDYAASFKRIDVTQKNLKNGSKNTHYDSPKVASDKFTGYMVINACEQCGGAMVKSTADDNTAVVYVVRKGDKTKGFKNVYRAVGSFNANMFGANAAWLNGKYVFGDKTKFTDASGFLAFPFSWGQILNTGFLGFDQQAADSTCYHGGYGKVTVKTVKTPVVINCEDDVLVSRCVAVKSLSGSMLSNVLYTGVCGEFLFDVCDQAIDHDAPIPGTFTLKLNTSKDFSGLVDFRAAEDKLIEKNKSWGPIFWVPAGDTAPALGLSVGEVWDTIVE